MTVTASSVRDAFKYLFPDELPALKSLVEGLPQRAIVVNIGAGAGTSGLAILEARSDVYLVTIDIQDASSPFGCLEAERDVIKRSGMMTSSIGRHWQFNADSVEVGILWLDEVRNGFTQDHRWGFIFKKRPQMVFIDGDHSYEHCRDDIQTWMALLEEGGILAVHDYQKDMIPPNSNGPHPKPWPGVDRAVDENLVGTYRKIMQVDSLIAFRKELL